MAKPEKTDFVPLWARDIDAESFERLADCPNNGSIPPMDLFPDQPETSRLVREFEVMLDDFRHKFLEAAAMDENVGFGAKEGE